MAPTAMTNIAVGWLVCWCRWRVTTTYFQVILEQWTIKSQLFVLSLPMCWVFLCEAKTPHTGPSPCSHWSPVLTWPVPLSSPASLHPSKYVLYTRTLWTCGCRGCRWMCWCSTALQWQLLHTPSPSWTGRAQMMDLRPGDWPKRAKGERPPHRKTSLSRWCHAGESCSGRLWTGVKKRACMMDAHFLLRPQLALITV